MKTIRLEKFFVFEYDTFYLDEQKKALRSRNFFRLLLEPVIRAFDRYNNVERVAELKITLYDPEKNDKHADFDAKITPPVLSQRCYSYVNVRRKSPYCHFASDYSRVQFCIDIEVPITVLMPPGFIPYVNFEDSSTKFVIHCKGETIEAIKSVLIAYSPVFETMFQSDFKEARENSMEITDFEPAVVRKMIEFCENYMTVNYDELEEELFKIAHKYEIQELMAHAVYEMVRTTTNQNRFDRYFLAMKYDLQEYKKWCADF